MAQAQDLMDDRIVCPRWWIQVRHAVSEYLGGVEGVVAVGIVAGA
jgi:hypothetical protein